MIYDGAGNLTGIEITEQTIPETKRTIYSPSGLANAYASYDGIYRYNGTVPAAPNSGTVKEETWVEKAAFDVMVYRDRNPDLAGKTDAELKKHWLESGIKEGRASSTVLDLGFYLNNNPDLKEAFGTDYEKVYNHFINSGYKEYRKSSALFDGSYYCENNPDVASSFKDEYMRHYVESGMKEGRRASLTFDPDYYWFIRPDVAAAWPGDYEMCAKHYAGHGVNAQIQAYDHISPVVSNVTISDISAQGYTVSCTATDDWGISKVVFPSWTALNDQDDLADNFMNTQTGTKNGDTYTFRVNASDHNNELGQYITHIYAIDKGGNQVQLVLDPVTVENPGPDEITLSGSASYERQGNILTGVEIRSSVDSLLPQFENEVLEVVDRNGTVLTADAFVGTGSQINLYDNGRLIDSVTVVVMGDVDGTGIMDTTDYLRIRSVFLGTYSLTDVENLAADMDANGIIDSTDYLKIKAKFLDI
jgi:hypothetical protein